MDALPPSRGSSASTVGSINSSNVGTSVFFIQSSLSLDLPIPVNLTGRGD